MGEVCNLNIRKEGRKIVWKNTRERIGERLIALVGCNAHSSHGCPLCIYISKPLHTDRRNRRQVCGNREQGNTTTSYGSTCIAITYSSGILNKWKSVESLETVREITDYTRLIAPRCALIETESTNYSVRIFINPLACCERSFPRVYFRCIESSLAAERYLKNPEMVWNCSCIFFQSLNAFKIFKEREKNLYIEIKIKYNLTGIKIE